jgi:hypothetical protein
LDRVRHGITDDACGFVDYAVRHTGSDQPVLGEVTVITGSSG